MTIGTVVPSNAGAETSIGGLPIVDAGHGRRAFALWRDVDASATSTAASIATSISFSG